MSTIINFPLGTKTVSIHSLPVRSFFSFLNREKVYMVISNDHNDPDIRYIQMTPAGAGFDFASLRIYSISGGTPMQVIPLNAEINLTEKR